MVDVVCVQKMGRRKEVRAGTGVRRVYLNRYVTDEPEAAAHFNQPSGAGPVGVFALPLLTYRFRYDRTLAP